MPITLRSTKGSALTHAELDANFSTLQADIATVSGSVFNGDYNSLTNKPTIPAGLDDLTDVTIATATSSQVLKYVGAQFVNSTLDYSEVANTPVLATVATSGTLSSLTDVATPTAGEDGFVLFYENATNSFKWKASGSASGSSITDGTTTLDFDGSNNLQLDGHFLPTQNIQFDLGSPTQRWRDIYLAGNTVHLGTGQLSYSGTNGWWTFGSPIHAEVVLADNSGFDVNDNLLTNYAYQTAGYDNTTSNTKGGFSFNAGPVDGSGIRLQTVDQVIVWEARLDGIVRQVGTGGLRLARNTTAQLTALATQADTDLADADQISGTLSTETNGANGLIAYNSDTNKVQAYENGAWVDLGGGGGTTSVPTQSTAPVGASDGDLWWDDVSGKLKIYYDDGTSSQWVDASPAGGSGGGGGLANIVEDTTPQLGGGLDLNSNNITGTGNINITGTIDATDLITSDTGFRTTGADGVYSTNDIETGGSYKFEGTSFATTLSKTEPTAARTITLPDASGTVALLSDISGTTFDQSLNTTDNVEFDSVTTDNVNPLTDSVNPNGINLDIKGGEATALNSTGGLVNINGGAGALQDGDVYIAQSLPAGLGNNLVMGNGTNDAFINFNNILVAGQPTFTSNVIMTAGVQEQFVALSGQGPGNVTYDAAFGQVMIHDTPTADHVADIVNLLVNPLNATNVTIMLKNAAATVIQSVLLNGIAPASFQWQGGTPPTGNPNATDVYSFTIYDDGIGIHVLGQMVSFA